MKVFFSVQPQVDYGADIIYDGLARVLGPENVLEYPVKPTYHGEIQKSRYPCFFHFYTSKTNEDRLEMLKNDEYEFIIVSCLIEDPDKEPIIKFTDELYSLLKEKSKTIPTFLLDQGDRKGIREDLIKDFNCKGYFKREHFGEDVFSLSYSYPPTIDEEVNRDIDLFWAGSFNSYRKAFLEACGASTETFTPEEYKNRLKRTRIGLNLRGFGFDTVRHYEIPAHGALLLSQKLPINIENEFVDGENAVFFETPEELKDKLKFLLDNPEEVERIRKNGYEHFKKHHTNIVRARQLLRRIYEVANP